MTETGMGNIAERIHNEALRCGFDKCAIIPISKMAGFDALYEKRIDDVPMSRYFYQGVGNLEGTRQRFPWAKSIVILVSHYGKYRYPSVLQGRYGKAFFLEPEPGSKERYDIEGFEKWLADNGIRAEGGEHLGQISVGPLRYIAMQSGLGIIRRNNFFYTENGSYNNLIGYVIDCECEITYECNVRPCPPKCDLCQRSCKTKALYAPYTINPFHCISFLTTFGNCEVPEGLTDAMYQQWCCGCDNCQDVCPFNRLHDWSEGLPLPRLEAIADKMIPSNVPNLSDEFIAENIIPKTDHHLEIKDIPAFRINAARAVRNETLEDFPIPRW